ncbi:hypothetical protein F2P44_26330 [Massilia sp. CCM 8695]|uniref:TFIIB-type domain-containing protein n=1 Tax=Massilia frigida TaxID=2609281 RepID=A0ABX0NHF6_9BURK|nr:hypothetical protein [Massilia frigida]NHZ82769.1 hypothetical protein [Massilia frigida]
MLVPEKLKQNAIISIQHGVEDFDRSRKSTAAGGDPFRAISAARNLYAGVLLLFKYCLIQAISDQTKAVEVIFKPPRDIIPHPDGAGGVAWQPVGKFQRTTIDVDDIKKRFEAFDIKVDWVVMERIQTERNHLEHLHPTQSVGAIGGFVADLFPILSKFITEELNEVPASLLGGAWPIMLAHHDFFVKSQLHCIEQWRESSMPQKAQHFVRDLVCDDCGSPLILPDAESDEAYQCMACGHSDALFPQLESLLEKSLGGYDPRDGEEPPTRDCPECDHPMFSVPDGRCQWCDYELEDWECAICGEGLGLDEQENGGLCSYHHYKMSKDD